MRIVRFLFSDKQFMVSWAPDGIVNTPQATKEPKLDASCHITRDLHWKQLSAIKMSLLQFGFLAVTLTFVPVLLLFLLICLVKKSQSMSRP